MFNSIERSTGAVSLWGVTLMTSLQKSLRKHFYRDFTKLDWSEEKLPKKNHNRKKNKTWRKANEEPQRSDPSPRKCNTLSQTYSCQKQVRVRQDPACNNTWQCALFHTFLSGLLFHWSHPQEESPMFGLEPHIQNKNKIIFPCIFKISALGV